MATFRNRNTPEGYSITRPPLFDNIPFDFWKTRMSTFLQSLDYRMWILVQDGYTKPTRLVDGVMLEIPFTDWTVEERDLAQLNAKCLNSFFCALKSEDYMRVSTCKSGNDIWDRLCITYEGTNEVKQSRLNILLHDYELFRMKPN
ncbi:hypothetical protein KFK09_014766 [Dendrobium nobile]|uniref:Uncharacterized protein n=1 Tax=Dendrobium nobile TaxID=94219 RepID=A0A8T3B5D0_DENNO|nr:hypothetical protein KFK09_014766 [Dendrobium nobile]